MGSGARTIGGFEAELVHLPVGRDRIALWRVAALERHVDRRALLAGDDPAEPPYWAHLWSGALVLAAAIAPGARTVVELGCGLALPGLVAARGGARVTLLDRVPAALAFARASAAANGLEAVDVVAADATAPPLGVQFDLVLAAELLYDRGAFAPLAGAIARLVAPRGRALVADAGRIDTRTFYEALAPAGLCGEVTEHRVHEEGVPLTVRLLEITHRGSLPPDGGGR